MTKLKNIGIIICLLIPSFMIYMSTLSLVEITSNSVKKIVADGKHILQTKIEDTTYFKSGACVSEIKSICIKNIETNELYCGNELLNSNIVQTTKMGEVIKEDFYYDESRMLTLLSLSFSIAVCNIINVILFIYILKYILRNKKNFTID